MVYGCKLVKNQGVSSCPISLFISCFLLRLVNLFFRNPSCSSLLKVIRYLLNFTWFLMRLVDKQPSTFSSLSCWRTRWVRKVLASPNRGCGHSEYTPSKPNRRSSSSLMRYSLNSLKMKCRIFLVALSFRMKMSHRRCATTSAGAALPSGGGKVMSCLRVVFRCFWQLWYGLGFIFFLLLLFYNAPLRLFPPVLVITNLPTPSEGAGFSWGSVETLLLLGLSSGPVVVSIWATGGKVWRTGRSSWGLSGSKKRWAEFCE